jgi:hypothetical protein
MARAALRRAIEYSIVPGSVAAGLLAVLAAARQGVDPALAVFVVSLLAFAWVALLERLLPYRRD